MRTAVLPTTMNTSSFLRAAVVAIALVLSGCAANQLHGYQNTYHAYNVPQHLLKSIEAKLRQHGLPDARVKLDLVGRVQLAGSYRDESEVDRAFVIVQSVVGIKSTSPFYPDEIRVKRIEDEVRQSLAATLSEAERRAPPRSLALVVGINAFRDKRITAVPGEDDARVVAEVARKARYDVTMLLGPQATKSAIEEALARLEKTLRPQDRLFVYVSSHGNPPLPTSRGGDQRKMSIVAWDTVAAGVDATEVALNIERTSVSDTLVQRLARKESTNTRIFIDTCYSGEMLSGFPDQSGGYIRATNGGQVERAGLPLQSWTGAAYTSKAIRFVGDRVPKDKSSVTPAEISPERAYAIITATSEGEESLAPGPGGKFRLGARELKGSFFTQSFFAFLEESKGHVEPAFERARKFTSEKAREVTGNKKNQVPRHFATESASRSQF